MMFQRTWFLILLSIFCFLLPPSTQAHVTHELPPIKKKKQLRQAKKRFRLRRKNKAVPPRQTQENASSATVLLGFFFALLMLAYIIGAVVGIFLLPSVGMILLFIAIIIWSLLGILFSVLIFALGDMSYLISFLVIALFGIPAPVIAGLVLGLPWLWVLGLGLFVLAVIFGHC